MTVHQLDHKRPTMAIIAYEFLRNEILSLRLSSNQSLVEAELAQMLAMSKTPVREALLSLSFDGLVEIEDFKGVHVRSFNQNDIREIYGTRLIVEPAAMRLAHANLTEEDYAGLRQTLEAARHCMEIGDRAELAGLNRTLHLALTTKCGNTRLNRIIGQMSDQVRLISLRSWTSNATYGYESDQHELIIDALENEDADRACELLSSHISGFLDQALRQSTVDW